VSLVKPLGLSVRPVSYSALFRGETKAISQTHPKHGRCGLLAGSSRECHHLVGVAFRCHCGLRTDTIEQSSPSPSFVVSSGLDFSKRFGKVTEQQSRYHHVVASPNCHKVAGERSGIETGWICYYSIQGFLQGYFYKYVDISRISFKACGTGGCRHY
jgi:hypothetical protein